MPRRYAVVCDDELSERVQALSREYDLTEQEVLRQLLRWGLEACDVPGVDDADAAGTTELGDAEEAASLGEGGESPGLDGDADAPGFGEE